MGTYLEIFHQSSSQALLERSELGRQDLIFGIIANTAVSLTGRKSSKKWQ